MNPAMLAALLRNVGAVAATTNAGRNQPSQSPGPQSGPNSGIMLTLSQLLTYLLQQQRAGNPQPPGQSPPGNQPPQPPGAPPANPGGQPAPQPPGPSGQQQGGLRSFMDSLGSAAGTVARVVLPFAKLAVAVVGFVKGLELMNMGVLALNRDLAQFNGGLAAAYASYDVDEMQRSVHRGQELSGPLSELAAAQSELRDGTNQVGTQFQGLAIQLLTGVTQGLNFLNKITGISDGIASTVATIRRILPWGKGGDDNTPGPWHTFFADVQDGKFDGKRPTFGGPKNLHSDADMKDIFG